MKPLKDIDEETAKEWLERIDRRDQRKERRQLKKERRVKYGAKTERV